MTRPLNVPLLSAGWLVAAALLIGSAGALFGCDKRGEEAEDERADATDRADTSKEASGANIEYADGPKPKADTVLAEGDDIEVTFADYEEALRRSLLTAPEGVDEMPKERLAMPRFQLGMARNLVRSAIIVREAERRELEATEEEKIEALSSHSRLSPLAEILEEDADDERLEEHDLDRSDVDEMATELVYEEKLAESLLDDLDDEALWEEWKREHDRFELLVVSTRNTPRGEELEAFIDEHRDRIEEHFEENEDDYRDPRMVRLLRLIPRDSDEGDRETFEEAAARLEKGQDPEKIAEKLGLRVDDSELMVRQENPDAFASEKGETGVQLGRPKGPYAWRVEGFREPGEAELDRAVEREIGAKLYSSQQIVDSRGERIEEAIAILEDLPADSEGRVEDGAVEEAVDKLDKMGLQVERTDSFARNERGYIPGVGLAEEVAEHAFEELSLDAPTTDEPILSREKVWAVRLLDRQRPDRDEFEENKDEFEQKLRDQLEDRIVGDFVSGFQDEHDVEFDLNPLRAEYGTLQKD
ncbi:MAG: hypothetical protein ACOCV2_01955 [Persicimonas sp.]